MGHLLGYARVSTTDQHPQLQVDALEPAGCYRVFTQTASGARTDRPVLEQALDQLRPGDTLVVWRTGSPRPLPAASGRHRHRTGRPWVGFRSPQEAIDATNPGGELILHVLPPWPSSNATSSANEPLPGLAAARAGGRRGGRPLVLTVARVRVAVLAGL